MLTLALRSLIKIIRIGCVQESENCRGLIDRKSNGVRVFFFSRAHHSKFVEEKEKKNVCGQTKISAYWISGTGSRSLTANKTWVWGPK